MVCWRSTWGVALLLLMCAVEGGDGAVGTIKVATCAEGYDPMVLRAGDGSTFGFEVDQWNNLYNILRNRVMASRNDDLIKLIGDEMPNLIPVRGLTSPEQGVQWVEDGKADVAFCGYYITPDRVRRVDASPPLLQSGYSMITSTQPTPPSSEVIMTSTFPELTPDAMFALLLLLVLSIIFAHFVWAVEREENESIASNYSMGVFDSWYMAMTVASTAGYGDKVPRSFLGKMLTIVWIFSALYCVAIFGASITTRLVSRGIPSPIRSSIRTPKDMIGLTVGGYFQQAQEMISVIEPAVGPLVMFPDIAWAYAALLRGDVDVLLDDTRIAQYQVSQPVFEGKLILAGESFQPVAYGIYMSRPNGTTHPLYPYLFRAANDYTRGDFVVMKQRNEDKWMYDRSANAVDVITAGLVERALMDLNLKMIAALATVLVVAALATAWSLREDVLLEKERQILIKLLGCGRKIDRYECRVGAAELYKRWDRDGNGKLDIREIVSAFVLNGIRNKGLSKIVKNEALLSSVGHRLTGLEQGDSSSYCMELADFQEMMTRLAIEGFQSDTHNESSTRNIRAQINHVMMLLDEFREVADNIERCLENVDENLDSKGLNEKDVKNRKQLPYSQSFKGRHFGDVEPIGISVPMPHDPDDEPGGWSGAVVTIDAALEVNTPEGSPFAVASASGGEKFPVLHTPSLEKMMFMRGMNMSHIDTTPTPSVSEQIAMRKESIRIASQSESPPTSKSGMRPITAAGQGVVFSRVQAIGGGDA